MCNLLTMNKTYIKKVAKDLLPFEHAVVEEKKVEESDFFGPFNN